MIKAEDFERLIEERGRRKAQKHHHGQQEKVVWEKVSCPYCDKTIQYVRKQDFKGILTCPHCGKEFRVPSLDEFL